MTLKQAFDEFFLGRSYCEFQDSCKPQQVRGCDTLCINSTRRDRKNQTCYDARLEYQILKKVETYQCPGTS